MTTLMHRISTTLRRRLQRRSLSFDALSPTVEITWADIMHDLDPEWHVGDRAIKTLDGGLR